MSCPVTRRKICSRFDPAAARSARDAQLGDRAVGDLPAAVHDDDARADLLDQVQQVRRQQDRRAGARRARRSSRASGGCRSDRARSAARRTAASSRSRTRPQAMTTFCRMPRDSSPGSESLLARQLELLEQRARRAARSRRRCRAVPIRRRCSSTVRYSNRCGSSGMNASRRLASIGSATRSWPSMRDVARGRPAGCPASDRSVVVLPAPLGPMSPTISPAATSNDRSSTAVNGARGRRVGAAEVLDGRSPSVLGLGVPEVIDYVATHASALKAHRQSLKNREQQPPVPVASAQRAQEHPRRHRRQRSGRREDRAEADHLAHRQDGEQGHHPPQRRRPLQVAPDDRAASQRANVGCSAIASRDAQRSPRSLPAHSSTTSRSSRTRGSPADRLRSRSVRNSASTAGRTLAGRDRRKLRRAPASRADRGSFSGGAPASSISAS